MTTDLPSPGASDQEDHVQMAHRFLEHAHIEADKGNRLQASEKVWGAVAHSLKAVGEQRGWEHRGHRNLLDVSNQLGHEFGRADDFYALRQNAEAMHVNFYENEVEESEIRFSIKQAESFVGELDRIREQPPRPFTVVTDDDQSRLARLLGRPRSELPKGRSDPNGFSRNPHDGQNGGSPAVRPPAPGDPPPGGAARQPGETGQAGKRRTRSRTPALAKPKVRIPTGHRKAEKPRIPGSFKPPRLPGKSR